MKISDIDTFVLGLDPKPQPVEEEGTYQEPEPEEEEAPAAETPKSVGGIPSGGTIAVTLSDAEVLAVIGPLHNLQRNAALLIDAEVMALRAPRRATASWRTSSRPTHLQSSWRASPTSGLT